ncbi:MAG: dienelactone hydrolase family protein [Pseudomonadota bacterium]
MLVLADSLGLPTVAVFAPEAAGHSWWPVSFLAPFDALEPWLDSALDAVGHALATIRDEGFADEQIVLFGFSQGGCLALEAVARRGGRVGAVAGFSSALIGTREDPKRPPIRGYPEKALLYDRRLEDVPVLLSCHEEDPHIPLSRVRDTEAALQALGGSVHLRLKPGAGHGIDAQDVAALRGLLNRPTSEQRP